MTDTSMVAPGPQFQGPAEDEMRDQDAPAGRKQLVNRLRGNVERAKKFWKKDFERMRQDTDLLFYGHLKEVIQPIGDGGTGDDEWDDGVYIANITQRHVQQRTAALYAKNPKALAKRRERKVYQIWDEDPKSLFEAQQYLAQMQAVGVDPMMMQMDPMAAQSQALLQDYQQGRQKSKLLDNVADTLVLLFHYFLDEQEPDFKASMKQLVRRTLATGVGYVKLGFQRAYQPKPDVASKIADITDRLNKIDQLMRKVQKQEIDGELEESAEAEELRMALQQLQSEPMVLVREGLTFDFPAPTAVIPDPAVRSLRGFVGADWVAEEFVMTPQEIEKVYDVKVNAYSAKLSDNDTFAVLEDRSKKYDGEQVLVWEYFDRETGMKYTIADGYDDFLTEPGAPDVQVPQFWPYFTLMFNEIEHEDRVYPLSDVRLMRSMQLEHNRTRQSLSEHRKASVPQYVALGRLEEEDLKAITANIPHTLINVQSANPSMRATDLIGQIQKAPIDPNYYTTNHLMEDVFFTVGTQEADLGGVSGATATESSIAASSRGTSLSSNVDDLDDFFTQIARSAGQVLLSEMTEEQVKKIAGVGAVWGVIPMQEIATEVFLEIEAGSSGRPNKAEDLANMERIMPFLLQLPGINGIELAKEMLRRFDDKLDLTRLIDPPMPSAVMMNAQTQPGTGDPASDPNQQGPQGGNNSPQAAETGGGGAPMGDNRV